MVTEAIEVERLDAVRRYDILDTPPDGAFDRITALAARLIDGAFRGLDAEAMGWGPCASSTAPPER